MYICFWYVLTIALQILLYSGRHALKAKLFELGYNFDGNELNQLFLRFKSLAEMKKIITDEDLITLVSHKVSEAQVEYSQS
ncbi:putative 2-isopropylmalate synthase [Helianthus anomalus]